MRGHRLIAVLVLSPALALAGCATPEGSPDPVREDFEKGIRNWEKAADVPEDPNRAGENVSWSINVTSERAAIGGYSANFTLDGSQDDGTIWLVRPLQVQEGQAYRANVTVEAWSGSESFNTLAHLVAYVGPEPPEVEEDFPEPGENTTATPDAERGGLREELNKQEGWREYGFGWNVPAEGEKLWAAVGISAVWETEMTYFVDDLEIRLDPIETGSGPDT
jgi:hypothetical protein